MSEYLDTIRRIYVEKKAAFAIEAKSLEADLNSTLGLSTLYNLRILNRYDIQGLDEKSFENALQSVFYEPPIDYLYYESFPVSNQEKYFAMQYLPGQFDQRADSAAQCLQIISPHAKPPIVKSAKIFVFSGISDDDIIKIKKYCINPIDSEEADFKIPQSLLVPVTKPLSIPILSDFCTMDVTAAKELFSELNLAMSFEDFRFCQKYFSTIENRDPTLTEVRVLDTYWSDHCRHTTFNTHIESVTFEDSLFTAPIKRTYNRFLDMCKIFNLGELTLMKLATIGAKKLSADGLLDDLDVSEEINACSIKADIQVNGETQPWLIMFKNETHNHPTEIEPFGGAATCLGGAIRDPLSGRAYAYQSLRLTGCGNPHTPVESTLSGKLPQIKISREAAKGFSSYGNQVGLATGQVVEIYDDGFVAKRMEIGAVIAAAPQKHVNRRKPAPGDVIILLGGQTGRDGCGGATGSSKIHDESSLANCGAEVQKGNAPTERKLQRLFRNPKAAALIKRCNDFGAGGVSVAVGELSEGVEINLDKLLKKYEGLDGTELAISESQERMAVVVAKYDATAFIDLALKENLEASIIAIVTDTGRVKMRWRNEEIVNISREFLNTNGIKQSSTAIISAPQKDEDYFLNTPVYSGILVKNWLTNLSTLNTASQKGLVEHFDSTVGAGTVMMPFGGMYQLTPALGMAAKIPLEQGETSAATLMTFGYNPIVSKWSPYHGAIYAVIESVSKITAMGGNPKKIRLTFQEFFEKLEKNPYKWGKPLASLLGALEAQLQLQIPAIGGKDSMSGSFNDLHVPPTLVSFAVCVAEDASKLISPEFKKLNSHVILIPLTSDIDEIPNWTELRLAYQSVYKLIMDGYVNAAQTIGEGGIAAAVSKMCFGNKIGVSFEDNWDESQLYIGEIGSILLEIDARIDAEELENLAGDLDLFYVYLGQTIPFEEIRINNQSIDLKDCIQSWTNTFESIFPCNTEIKEANPPVINYRRQMPQVAITKFVKPRVFIPAFPGTNCENDTARAFEDAGGNPIIRVFRNLNTANIIESIEELVRQIKSCQIIALPGGFSAGDEPDGSGKFIASVFHNRRIMEAIEEHLLKDGLILGICNGFQALIKLGLVPYGKIQKMQPDSPTLTYNTLGRHISRFARTKIVSTLSPWFNSCDYDSVYNIPFSHGEGRFVASDAIISELIKNGQIATQYVDIYASPSMYIDDNPNGSMYAIEGITSPDGKILGKMGHSERVRKDLFKNVSGNKVQPIFLSGIKYFS